MTESAGKTVMVDPTVPATWSSIGILGVAVDPHMPAMHVNGLTDLMISIDRTNHIVKLLTNNGTLLEIMHISGIIGITFEDKAKEAIDNGL